MCDICCYILPSNTNINIYSVHGAEAAHARIIETHPTKQRTLGSIGKAFRLEEGDRLNGFGLGVMVG